MNNIIVFGGAGFIGSYLTEELLSRGHNVIVADIHSPKYPNVAKFVSCDINSIEQINSVFSDDIDYVYNLAGFANLDEAVSNPLDTIRLNIMGNVNILEVIKEKKIKRYIYGSSAYAMNDKGSFYGISKLSSEKIIKEYKIKYGLAYSILRYGSIYSERNFDNNYIYNLVREIILQKSIANSGDGEEVREYIHASDVARMAADVIDSEKYEGQYLILTGVERMKRAELFEMIKEILGHNFEIQLKADENTNHYKYSPYALQANMSRKLVGNTYIDIGQGILECIKNVYKEIESE